MIESAAPSARAYELRDTEVKGFLCKVTPSGRKVFMLAYRNRHGQKRKPAIGLFGVYTVQEAREVARKWLQEAHAGDDPSRAKSEDRVAPLMSDLCERFMRDHSELHNKPRTQQGYQQQINQRVLPALGSMAIEAVARTDILTLMRNNAYSPTQANRTLALLKKMFNCAELWGLRHEGSNPCRLVKMYPTSPRTRLLSDAEVQKIFHTLARLDRERRMHPTFTFVCRMQFALAARIGEVLNLEWDWINFDRKLIEWPDSKTGTMKKFVNDDVVELLDTAPSKRKSKFVCPSIKDPKQALNLHTYYSSGWRRILEEAGVRHCGTHHVRHRAVTDIANAVTNVRTGMSMTGHKTVAMFMRYVHPEEERIRAANAEIARRRLESHAVAPAKS
jgi:integrase